MGTGTNTRAAGKQTEHGGGMSDKEPSAVSQPCLKAPRGIVQQGKFRKVQNKVHSTHRDSRVINNGLFYRPVKVRRRFTRSDVSQHLHVYGGNIPLPD